ncbi:hypothetical protein HRG_000512 [Hirsutella rhossiliensis]|uniref:Uncharacterized protein n=1 Tax=Hirsutella rhossiliensis TaxID=111463 RepID=A0A9P8N6S9_9HYPO|nr:uncharacterized protein HRG_00512 [Hirsutella rhossiliensis]KAH0967870.1 hypothetical protein HRG_00512 [Hirsutella rhossiliensis]
MPPFFDGAQIRDALRYQAIPAIEALAANEDLHRRSLRRFERDDPPPYASSTDSSEPDDTPLLSSDEIDAILDPPITDQERDWMAQFMADILHPGKVYYKECQIEAKRLDYYRSRNVIFSGKKGRERFGVIVRRNVRHRWEKLGIWNPAWGFPGRSLEPKDLISTWNWWWRQSGPWKKSDGEELVDRALRQRQNLRRGESVPVPPRSHLEHGMDASQADSFIVTRPWFVFQLELNEESLKCRRRLPTAQRHQVDEMSIQRVNGWWRDRGDWRNEFDSTQRLTSWKWRHESPSPEPEDITAFEPTNNTEDNPLDTMDLTPSETDALETIELPRSEQPKKFWAIFSGDFPPFFPGQQQPDPAEDQTPSPRSQSALPASSPPGWALFRPTTPLPQEHVEGPPEFQETSSQPQQNTSASPPPQKPRRRGRGRPRRGAGRAQDPQSPSLPPRRHKARRPTASCAGYSTYQAKAHPCASSGPYGA